MSGPEPNDAADWPLWPLYLIRFSGELSIKARKTRQRLTTRLAENLKDALQTEGIPFRLERAWARFYVRSPDPRVADVLGRVFGISSISAAVRREWSSLEDVVAAGEEVFGEVVVGKTFAVRARKGGDSLHVPFRSVDLERALGARLLARSAGVDLEGAEAWLHVEVQPGVAYFFRDRHVGADGLPVAFEGRAVALVSGGFDSIVAAWQILRRGAALDFVFCNLGGAKHRDGVLAVMKRLIADWGYGYRPRLHVVDFTGLVLDLQERTPEELWQVILKRLMLRAADGVARRGGAVAIVTGESIGQVSSQTLRNLAAISSATSLPILRPLAGATKGEILHTARRIGTYELSAKVPEYCSLAVHQPATNAKPGRVVAAEARLDLALIDGLIEARAIVDLRTVDLDAAKAPDLEVRELPEGATLVDLRSPTAFAAGHHPDAVRLDYLEALKAYRHLDKTRTYVFTCELGMKSAHLAELAHGVGVTARHVRLAAIARAREG